MIKKAIRQIVHIFQKETVIPPYEEKRSLLDHYRTYFNLNTLVETGTFFGDTVNFFKDKCNFVYSIELSEELAAKAAKRFASDNNVKILQGDSGKILSDLVKEITTPALFWLDGHYSSEFFVNGEFIKTAKSDKDTPVEKELITLMNAPLQHVILIDDARLFNGQGDYPSIYGIKKIVSKSKYRYEVKVEKDIILILPIS